jgi:hypothetical protein
MINPLSIATRGRIANTAKRTLTIATIGWITITAPVPTNTSNGGAGRYLPNMWTTHDSNYLKRKAIERHNEQIKQIVKIITECL